MNPFAVGPTAVTFNKTPDAPTGTGVCVPLVVGTGPLICSFCETADTNGPARPTFTGSRVSSTRTGVTFTIVDSAGPGAADARKTPPPPIDTATAAPSAAQRDLHTIRSLIYCPFANRVPIGTTVAETVTHRSGSIFQIGHDPGACRRRAE